jgi:poly(A) polymerase
VGAHFGVVIVREADAAVEVATFRSDHSYSDGRRPDKVHFEIDPRQDALRRDFTINAMMFDPETEEVLDFFGGRADLEARIVRAVGDPAARFREDHLRLLRAVRFAARLGFTIEPETIAAMRANHALIRRIAVERVREELVRILTEGGARRGFELLDETGLLDDVLPEIAALKGVQQPPQYHPEGDVWVHTLIMLEGLDHPTPELAMGVLLHDVGKPATFTVSDRIRFNGHVEKGVEIARGILARLRFSREESEQVEALVAQHMRFMHVHQMKNSTLKKFLRMPRFEEHLALHRLDCLSSNGNLENYEFAQQKLVEFNEQHLKPAPLITGSDLIAAGYKPGPQFSVILGAVEDAQLEGELASGEAAVEFVRARFPAAG